MVKVVSPKGNTIRFSDNNILVDGLVICLEKMNKMKKLSDIEDYLTYGSIDLDIKEEIARLLLVATTLPSNTSPVLDISNKVKNNEMVNINSMFIKEFLEMRERNKKDAFMKSNFYKQISRIVEEMNMKQEVDNSYYLNDGIVLTKNIRNLYISNLDKNIESNRLAINYREPLIELFQNSLDCTLDKIKNGVKSDVQVQRKY